MCEECDRKVARIQEILGEVKLMLSVLDNSATDADRAELIERNPALQKADLKNPYMLMTCMVIRLGTALETISGNPSFVVLGELAGLIMDTHIRHQLDQNQMVHDVMQDISRLQEIEADHA